MPNYPNNDEGLKKQGHVLPVFALVSFEDTNGRYSFKNMMNHDIRYYQDYLGSFLTAE
jgi:hypothetical protein